MAATAVPLRSRRRPRGRSLRRVGDERLVARVRAGDDDAFEAIYDRYYLGLLAFCRHMLGSRQEAEDALQHSFASAYKALRRGHSDVDLRPWLFTIARNRCLSALRARREELDIDGVDVDRRSFDGLPTQIQMRAELRELVEDLQRLPDDQRAALVLFELGDHSHDEIAAVLGVRREKVKALVFQARSGLLRARRARDASCEEIREQIAGLLRGLPKRGLVRAHVDRCEACAAFEREVRRQRSALAAILPVVPSAGLKATVLGFALGGGGGAAAITGATVGGGAAVGGGVALGTAGVATVAGGVVTGTAPGLGALGAKGLVTKLLTVVAVAGGGGEAARHAAPRAVEGGPAAVTLARSPILVTGQPLLVRHRIGERVAARPPRPLLGGPADAALPLTVPAPAAPYPTMTPAAPLPAPAAAQRPATQPPAAQAATTPDPPAAAPTAAPDPVPAPADAAPDPTPAADATTDSAPAAADTSPAAPATTPDSTPATSPDPTSAPAADPSATTTTPSPTDAPPPPAVAPAAAADAQS
jgi:RNA polymerase sigma factor (sigma-70 family)